MIAEVGKCAGCGAMRIVKSNRCKRCRGANGQ